MEEQLNSLKEALRAAEDRATEAEANMMRAAQAGKELLEQLQYSEKNREGLEQEKHELKLALQSKEASEAALQEELQGAEA